MLMLHGLMAVVFFGTLVKLVQLHISTLYSHNSLKGEGDRNKCSSIQGMK